MSAAVVLYLQSTNAVNDLWANELKKILGKKKAMGIDQLTNKVVQQPAAGQVQDQPAQIPADKVTEKVGLSELSGQEFALQHGLFGTIALLLALAKAVCASHLRVPPAVEQSWIKVTYEF
jgi:hypothetical protein